MTDTATPGIKRLNPGIMSEQVAVRVKNVGPKKLRLEYANNTWHIDPGQEAVAPYLAACYWFGDPRSVDIGHDRNSHHRTREIDRLSVLYGVYSEAFWVDEDGVVREEEQIDNKRSHPAMPYVNRRHPYLPQVEVYDITTNERILTVIDDPEGNLNEPQSNAQLESAAMADQIRAMQQQMNSLAALLAQTDPTAAAEVLASSPPAPNFTGAVDTSAIAARLEGDDDPDSEGPLADPEPDPASRATVDGTSAVPKTKRG